MMKQSFRIAGLGEVWWDVFPDQIHFGGAAANYACRAQMLGGQCHWSVVQDKIH